MSNMNRLSTADRTRVVSALVEGNSLLATARMTGIARMTVEKLLRDLGVACQRFHDATVRNVKSQRVQCDEIWAFCYAKRGNVTPEIRAQHPDAGDVWTWTALDADTKLMIGWYAGNRTVNDAYTFLSDVKERLANRVQLTTDGFTVYLRAVEDAFGDDIDYATLTKIYASSQDGRYSPPRFKSAVRATIRGNPDAGHISTSFVERQNLTMRMSMRRFTRLTNAFTKKVENHAHAVALHFVYYNFCRVHQTLRVTPAMEAGLSDHVWSIDELVGLLESHQKLTA
jgi:IS1 family transposase